MVRELINLYSENTYIINEKKICFIIDPGAPIDQIKKIIDDNEFSVEGILLTHGHFDHIYSLNDVFNLYQCPIYIHEDERDFLFDPNLNLSSTTLRPITFLNKPFINVMKDKDTVTLGRETIKVMHTPGHTRGGVCYLYKRYIFTGDTLFKGTIGRHDLPTSNRGDLHRSLQKIVKACRDNVVVYPGHGDYTTILNEKEDNMYIKNLKKG
jgi:glyoxylase-like metal-dependent hydrolase (beta-lactamase superfamily II)